MNHAAILFLSLLLLTTKLTTQLSVVSSSSSSNPNKNDNSIQQRSCKRIGIIGGGASGMFAATAAAEAILRRLVDRNKNKRKTNHEVVVLEGGKRTMTKVAISGGGRCNVMHDTSKPLPTILEGYPRGKKELTGLMTKRFSPAQAEEWFTNHGVTLKTEEDGRMFPIKDSSQTIIDAITQAASRAGVIVRTDEKVLCVEKFDNDNHNQFVLTVGGNSKDGSGGRKEIFDSVILATGSSPTGYEFASSLGHTIVKTVPSLFTLNAKHQVKEGGILHGLSGLSVKHARVTLKVPVPGKKKKKILTQEGPVLITHHGLSGPAVLRLSAFGAREFHDMNYRATIMLHWAPELGETENIEEALWRVTTSCPKRAVSSSCPLLLADGSIVGSRDNIL